MILILQIQLLPDNEQAAKLKSTIERFNEACSWLAKQAFDSKSANKITLQKNFYYDLRNKFELSAQMAAICIRHVGGTYGRDKSILPVFRPNAAMPYVPVDPRNTSRTCPECGHIDKGNRPVRALFLCRSCGHFDHADVVGATNIACAAKVAWREVAEQGLKPAL